MSNFVYEEALIYKGTTPPTAIIGKIREHHPAHNHSTGRSILGHFGLKGRELHKVGGTIGGQQLTTTPFATAPSDGSLLNPGADVDFVEFRFPHTQKHDMGAQFLGAGTGIGSRFAGAKKIRLQNAPQVTVTFGKMGAYDGKHKVLSGSEASSIARGGVDAGMELGGSIAGLVAATGATVATAGVTLGVGLGVAVVAVTATAANNYRGRIRNKQVFLRVSRSAASGQLKAYYPYEEKIYRSQGVGIADDAGGISFQEIYTLMRDRA